MQSGGWAQNTLRYNNGYLKGYNHIWVLAVFCYQGLVAQISHSVLGTPSVNGNEPSISFDLHNSKCGIVGFNTNQLYITLDGGKAWSPILLDPPQGFYGDPVIKTAKNGSIFLAHLAHNKTANWPDFFDRIVFERSVDQGKTFASSDVGFRQGKMQDKPWFEIDEWPKSKGNGNIYLSWTEFDKYGSVAKSDSSRIWFAKSADAGLTFEKPVIVSDVSGDSKDGDATAEGANIAVSQDGVLHAVWSRNDTIWYDRSIDFGLTWGRDRCIAVQNGGWSHEDLLGTMRSNGMPFIVADRYDNLRIVYSGGACAKQLLMDCKERNIYAIKGNARTGIFEEPQKINNDKGMAEQYSPMIAINPDKSRVFVVWHDRRRSETGYFYDLYGAELGTNKRYSWQNTDHDIRNIRLTSTSSVAPGNAIFMGDYIGLDWKKNIHIAYTGFDVVEQHPTIQFICIDHQKKPGKIWGYLDIEHPDLIVNLIENTAIKSSTIDTDSSRLSPKEIAIWAAWPDATSFTLEFKLGKQIVFEHVFENLKDSKVDFCLPASRFSPGVYEIVLRMKGKKVKQGFYLY